ncbi:hypothetical protein CALCODRAFT_167109 [Calocera cornea HHB12733]|uniref:Uncharacterized protein n=1 Tax=Calocera cornea HHB12733 TaxID=1353952 RepID=A0A165HXX9_9BASI|nr:hypothetical protein CALCODRAFT_167109 [Calocera cornea HHB12733]
MAPQGRAKTPGTARLNRRYWPEPCEGACNLTPAISAGATAVKCARNVEWHPQKGCKSKSGRHPMGSFRRSSAIKAGDRVGGGARCDARTCRKQDRLADPGSFPHCQQLPSNTAGPCAWPGAECLCLEFDKQSTVRASTLQGWTITALAYLTIRC